MITIRDHVLGGSARSVPPSERRHRKGAAALILPTAYDTPHVEPGLDTRSPSALTPPPHIPAVITTEATRQAIAQLRRFARDMAAHWGLAEDVADALRLVMSEYASNAVEHSGSADVTAMLTRADDTVTMYVKDAGQWRQPPVLADAVPECGRGLLIVRAYSAACGVHRTRQGTTAWALIRTAPTSGRSPD